MPDKKTLPEAQAASDVLMATHGYADKTQEYALKSLTAVRAAADAVMRASPMMRSEYSKIEGLLLEAAKAPTITREAHFMASQILRKYGIELPVPGPYDPEYDIGPVTVEPAKVMRR